MGKYCQEELEYLDERCSKRTTSQVTASVIPIKLNEYIYYTHTALESIFTVF